MVKKLVLLMALFLLPVLAMADVQVVDPQDEITAGMEAAITRAIDAIEAYYPVDVVILVTHDVPHDPSVELTVVGAYCDDFYDQGGYGAGEDCSGLLYVIDLNNGVQYVSTAGAMIPVMTDARLAALFEAAEPHLLQGEWGCAALTAVACVHAFLTETTYAADLPDDSPAALQMAAAGGEVL